MKPLIYMDFRFVWANTVLRWWANPYTGKIPMFYYVETARRGIYREGLPVDKSIGYCLEPEPAAGAQHLTRLLPWLVVITKRESTASSKPEALAQSPLALILPVGASKRSMEYLPKWDLGYRRSV